MKRRGFTIALGIAMFSLANNASAAPRGVSTKSSPTVAIDAGDIDVEVEGWSKKRVEVVSADLGAGSNVVIEQKGARVTIRFDLAGGAGDGEVKLRVPKKADVRIASRSGDISATAQEGEVRLVSIDGDVELGGALRRAAIVTTSGDIEVSGSAGDVEAKTVSGDIEVQASRGSVRAKTVSGDVSVKAKILSRFDVASVSGDISFAGALGRGRHGVDSHSGSVEMKLPKKSSVSFNVRSFSGTISDAFAQPTATARRRYTVHHGDGGPDIEVSTFSGDVVFTPR